MGVFSFQSAPQMASGSGPSVTMLWDIVGVWMRVMVGPSVVQRLRGRIQFVILKRREKYKVSKENGEIMGHRRGPTYQQRIFLSLIIIEYLIT